MAFTPVILPSVPPPNGKLPQNKQLLRGLFYIQRSLCSLVLCYWALCRSRSEDRTMNLLTGSFLLLIAIPWSIAEVWIIFCGRDPCERQMFHPCVDGKQLWSHLLICNRWFKMPGIRFVSCHLAKIDTFTVLFLPLASARKIGIDYFCHLVFQGPRRQGIGSDWPLGKNLFQVICSSQVKMQAWDPELPGTLTATLDFVFFLLCFFRSACFPPPVELNVESYNQSTPLLDAVHLVQ